MANIKFWLDGCDICFLAEAPEDIKLKDLLALCDRIEPDYCACGLKSYINPDGRYASKPEIIFTMDTVTKEEDTACKIHKDDTWYKNRCYGIKGDDDSADN